MYYLAAGFLQYNLRVTMVLVKARGVFLSQLPSNVQVVDLNSINAYAAFPKLIHFLQENRPTALLSALDLTNLIAILAKIVANVPTRVVVTAVNTVSIQERSPLKKILEQILLRNIYPLAHNIVAVSNGVARDLSNYANIQPNQICTIYNPVITSELYERANEPVEHPWLDEDNIPLILGVGRLTKAKDFSTLIRAVSIVHKSAPVRLIILGEGDERPNLKALANRLGLSSEVCLLGFSENPFPYYKKSSVFVLSSLWEGLPTVLIEALACGCPVVSTDCPSGPFEILDGGNYGHLVPVGDIAAMAEAILSVLNGDKRRPPDTWLRQFELGSVIRQYLVALGMERELDSPAD